MLLHNGFVRIHFLIQTQIKINPHTSHDHYNNELISFYGSSQQSLSRMCQQWQNGLFLFATATAGSFCRPISQINCVMKIHTYHVYQLSERSHNKIVSACDSHNKSPYVAKKQAPSKKRKQNCLLFANRHHLMI